MRRSVRRSPPPGRWPRRWCAGCPATRARRLGEHRRGERRQLRIGLGVSAAEPRIRSGLAAAIAAKSGLVRVPAPGTSWMTVPRWDGCPVAPSAMAAATTRDCRPSAQSASSSSPASTTMRCGSGTTAVSPAACRTGGGEPGRAGPARCAGLVRAALVAQHAGAGDLGGAGDRAAGGSRRRCLRAPRTSGGDRQDGRAQHRRGGRDTTRTSPAQPHAATVTSAAR